MITRTPFEIEAKGNSEMAYFPSNGTQYIITSEHALQIRWFSSDSSHLISPPPPPVPQLLEHATCYFPVSSGRVHIYYPFLFHHRYHLHREVQQTQSQFRDRLVGEALGRKSLGLQLQQVALEGK